MELILYKTNWLSQRANKFFMAPTRDLNCHHHGAFLLGPCRDGGKVLIPHKALRIQRSSLLEAPKTAAPQDGDGCTGPRVLREPAWCRIRHICGPVPPGSPLLQSWMSVWKQLGNLCPFSPSSFRDWVPQICSVPEPFFSTSPRFRTSEEFLVTSYPSRGC